MTAACISAAVCDALDVDSGIIRGRLGGRDQGHRGAAVARRPRQGEAHLAARAVAEDAHRIERLAGAAGGHQAALSGQVAAPAEQHADVPDQGVRLQHAALAACPGGVASAGRAGHGHAIRLQLRDVAPGGGMAPHLRLHRWRHQHRRAGAEHGEREQVVRQSVGEPGQGMGGGGRDGQQVRVPPPA